MKSFQQNLLIAVALSLCGLCVYQWYGQTLQRNEILKLDQLVYDKSAAIQGYTNSLRTMDRQIAQMDARLTGLKAEAKVYRHFTGYPGGLKQEAFRQRFARSPQGVVQEAIEGMLPKTKLGRAMAKKLKVYKGDKHPHEAQKPELLAASPA